MLKKKFNVKSEELGWVNLKSEDFIIGPLYAGEIREDTTMRILLNTESSSENSIPYIKKKDQDNSFMLPSD
jgi:hypothetical protein